MNPTLRHLIRARDAQHIARSAIQPECRVLLAGVPHEVESIANDVLGKPVAQLMRLSDGAAISAPLARVNHSNRCACDRSAR